VLLSLARTVMVPNGAGPTTVTESCDYFSTAFKTKEIKRGKERKGWGSERHYIYRGKKKLFMDGLKISQAMPARSSSTSKFEKGYSSRK
jgi:hypothetical protein